MNSAAPLISVIIPTFNYGRFLCQTIDSVLFQEVEDIEVLVFDNASEDETQSLMSKYASDSRVVYRRHDHNIGPAANVLCGLEAAKGEFLCILSADDFYAPGFLKKAIKHLKQYPNSCLAYSSICFVDSDGNKKGVLSHPGYKQSDYFGGRNEVADLLIYDNYVTPSASVYRRGMLMNALEHDHSLSGAGDWFTAIQVAALYPDFIFISEPGVFYRVHEAQFSSGFYGSNAPLLDHVKIIENVISSPLVDLIKGAEDKIRDHLQSRLDRYPNEINTDLGLRADRAIKELDQLYIENAAPFFSVILSTFNRIDLLKDALQSLKTQTFNNFEVILVNDCGVGVEHVLVGFWEFFPITYIRQGINQGLSAARNASLKLARGRYITYLDDDDIYLPDHLQCLADAFNQHPDAVVYTDVVYVQEKLEDGRRIEVGRSFLTAHDAFDRDKLFAQNYIPVNTWAHPRAAIAKVGNFDTGLTAFEDWDLLLRLVQHYPIHRVEQITAEVHQRISGGTDHMLDRERDRLLSLYDKIYARYPETGNERVQAARQAVLSQTPQEADWGASKWLTDRAPSSSRILAIQAMLQANPDVGTLGVAVITPADANPEAVADTLSSLSQQHRSVDGVWLIGDGAPSIEATYGPERVGGDAPWPRLLSRRIGQGDTPDFLWILHPGDQLLPHATLTMGEYRLRKPDPLVWYADEDALKAGTPASPMLKPDFNIDLLRSYPYVGRNLVLSTAAIQAVGGLDGRLADLAPIDLIWRMVEQAGPGVIGHVPEVLFHGARNLIEWVSDAQTLTWSPAVTQAHFVRMGLEAQVLPGATLGLFRVEYPLPMQPLVSIIVPTRDQFLILRDCVEGLMEHTAYPNYELLIVDNGSIEPDAVAFLTQLEGMALDQVRVLRWSQPFDFSAINNFAVSQARGDVLLFLNNDIQFSEKTRSDWLERLLRLALRPEVGMAGARLDLPDGRVDQCGQVLGLDNSVGSAFRGEESDKQGYMYRLAVQQNTSALSASCLMIRRTVFEELGGFDAESFPIYYADTDLSLKAVRAGYLLALEPDMGLLHLGGATRLFTEKFGLTARPDDQQRDSLYARWLPQLARDPYYHPAFGKLSPGFNLSQDASRIHEPLPGRPLPVVLAAHGDWQGCGHYRILHPFKAMANELRLEGGLKHGDFHFTDVARIQPDVIVLQGAWLNPGILTQIRRYREITGAKVVLEFDDYLPNIPTRSVYRKMLPRGVIKHMRRAIEQADWVVVSTPVLAQEYSRFHHDVRVALNGLLPEWWGQLGGQRRTGKKMRVGWAGGSSHTGDLAEIRSVVRDLQDEVEWVFMGMKPDDVVCEFHSGVPIDRYPAKLAALNLDLAVVPLELNQFNRSKSNLRLLELGACGVPIICTDIEPYQGTLPVTPVRNRPQDWVRAIRDHLADPDATARQGDALRTAVLQDWMLEGAFLDQWVKAWGVMPEET